MKKMIALLVVVSAGNLYSDSPSKLAEQVDSLVQPYLDAEIVNAISIGVVQRDKQWTRHYGQLSKVQPQQPDDATIYELGSISKVFTGILLADAVVDGRMKLNQPLGDLVPELETNKEVGEAIQLWHLSTHVSGLPRMPINMRPADIHNPYADYDRSLMLAFLGKVKPIRKPEAKAEYSNLAVGLLGQILAIEAEQSYEELLQQNLTGPLGMTQTSITLSTAQQRRLAPPHNSDRESAKIWDLNSFVGAGGIRSTTADMLTFIRANLNPSDDRTGQALNLAWKQHFPANEEAFAMGLGWHLSRDGETRWHNGQTGGYHTMMMVDRRINSGVILLCNTATGEVDALAESIIRLVAGMKVEPRTFPKQVKVDSKVVSRLVGEYQIFPQFVLTIWAEDDQLYAEATGQPEIRIYPDSNTKWRCRVVDAQLTFELPETGPATAVTLHQNGRDMRGPRVEQK